MLRRTFSLGDKGMYLVSSSTVVMRLRNCHFQSFQDSAGTWLKKASLIDRGVLLGGSSSSAECLVTGLIKGGSASTSLTNLLFRSAPDLVNLFKLLIVSNLCC